MAEQQFFTTIEKPCMAEFKDKGSRFIAYGYPIESIQDFKDRLIDVKKEHPKATHHCFAYRLGVDGNTFRVSDDGEPSGTAGRPILGQIDSKEVTNTLIIVVRYFGGTLLGVPGLIHAYKASASMALQVVPLIKKDIFFERKLQFNYHHMNDVMMVLKQGGCHVVDKELSLFCLFTVAIPIRKKEEVLFKLQHIVGVEILETAL